MGFIIEKYALLIIKTGRRETSEGIELPNQERMAVKKEKNKKRLFSYFFLHKNEKTFRKQALQLEFH